MSLFRLMMVLTAGPLLAAPTDPKALLIEQRLAGFSDGEYAPAVERSSKSSSDARGDGSRPPRPHGADSR